MAKVYLIGAGPGDPGLRPFDGCRLQVDHQLQLFPGSHPGGIRLLAAALVVHDKAVFSPVVKRDCIDTVKNAGEGNPPAV